MPNNASNLTPDQIVTSQHIESLILQVTTAHDSIMNKSPTDYEFKRDSNQVSWCSKKDQTQEASFVIVGEISPNTRLGLYGDHLDQYINLSFVIIIIIIYFWLFFYKLLTLIDQ